MWDCKGCVFSLGQKQDLIEHSGTVTLALGDAEVTVGDFSIGFDPTRVSDTATGYFVADTLDDALGLEILFDVGVPEALEPSTVDVNTETISLINSDLFLAPELAAVLGNTELTGADIGDTRIDADVAPVTVTSEETITIGETIIYSSV